MGTPLSPRCLRPATIPCVAGSDRSLAIKGRWLSPSRITPGTLAVLSCRCGTGGAVTDCPQIHHRRRRHRLPTNTSPEAPSQIAHKYITGGAVTDCPQIHHRRRRHRLPTNTSPEAPSQIAHKYITGGAVTDCSMHCPLWVPHAPFSVVGHLSVTLAIP